MWRLAYAVAMNDPWSNLVETLAGNERPTPSGWPQRKVHRIMDDSLMVDPQPRPMPRRAPVSSMRGSAANSPRIEPAMRLRCPCTTCAQERMRLAS